MESLVTIGIPDLAGPAARITTLASLACHTPEPHEIALLTEKSRVQNVTTDSDNQALRQIAIPAPFGVPAALNQLLEICTTPYILLLESGAIVTSGWFTRLLAAIDDPTIGMSGPSTNISWNEQQIVPGSGGVGWSIAQIDTYAATVATRYSGQRRPLDTLHSLGDFCYLFKRSVAEQLGGFDEAYGAGPCWEIDFNTRAARAGFKCVWVADAYVHRAPTPSVQVQTIRRLFTPNKHLYQDRFCGLRLRGEKTSYEVHCRGEACEHFAPRDLIQIALQPGFRDQPLEELPRHKEGNINTADTSSMKIPPVDATSISPAKTVESEGHSSISSQPGTPVSSISDIPLISCIMPTCNRRAFINQALIYFEQQDYPHRELIIVDDGDDRILDLLPSDPRVRYIPLPRQTPIGAKRNIACEQARGDFIAHWDDDDWYAPHRLQYQVTPLLENKADMTGLEASCFFDLTNWQTWACTPELHRHLFVGDVHGGTLVYRRWVWERLARYRPISLAEDAFFLQQARQRGARLQKLPHAYSFVYIRHDSNAWRFPLGSYLQPAGWKRVDVSTFLPAADMSFYIALSPAAPSSLITSSFSNSSTGEEGGGENHPLVSCIMPTYNRRAFVPQAIAYFLRQDYANKELIIVDDGIDAVGDLVPADQHIRYIRLSQKTTLGVKRNIACEQARGTIIAHWDDDDWHAPHRLRYQVGALLREGTDLCGIYTLLFYDIVNERAWQYMYPNGQKIWLSGSTLCYRRAFWASNCFAPTNVGEDARFVWNSHRDRLTVLGDTTFHVGMIHKQNVSPKKTNGSYWRSYPVEEIRRLLGGDWDFYQPHPDHESMLREVCLSSGPEN